MPLQSLKNKRGYAPPYSFVWFPLCWRVDGTGFPEQPSILGSWSPRILYMEPSSWFLSLG